MTGHAPGLTAVAAAIQPTSEGGIQGSTSATKAERKRAPIAPALLDDEQSAELLGVSRRKFHELRDEPWWTVRAVVLGTRLLRWHRQELEQAIASMPREQSKGSEPAALARARINRLKATGVPA